MENDQLADVGALLAVAVDKSRNLNHRVLASRALVRARLQHWDAAFAEVVHFFFFIYLHI